MINPSKKNNLNLKESRVTINTENEEIFIENLTISNPDTYCFLKDKENLVDWTKKALIIGCVGLRQMTLTENIDFVEKEFNKFIAKAKETFEKQADNINEKIETTFSLNNTKSPLFQIKELIDIQEKLHATVGRKRKKLAIGIYPLEKIKLPIYYKALEPDKIKFIPLEATREMSGLEILQRHPTGRDYAHLLAGKSKFPVFIDADKNVLSMPPIINSQST